MTKRKNSKEPPRTMRPGARLLLGLSAPLLGSLVCSTQGAAQEPPPPGQYFTKAPREYFSYQPCVDPEDPSKEGCFTHWLQLSDLDSDGDLDVLFASGGGYFVVGNAEPSAIYFNDGNAQLMYVSDTLFGGALSRSRQIAVGDIDGDGDKDVYQPGSWGVDNDKLYVQVSPGVWEDQAAQRLPGSLRSRYTSAAFGDLDGDGDLDLAVADWGDNPNKGAQTSIGNVWIYLNDGSGRFSIQPSYVVPPPIPVAADAEAGIGPGQWGNTPLDIDLADIDGDFDLDILLDHRNGQNRIFINDGTGFFTDATENYPLPRTYKYNQEVCDIDGDGDLDILLDNAAQRPEGVTRGNFTQVLINDGTGFYEDKSRELIFGEAGTDDNAAKCADVNGDGLYDIVVSTLNRSMGEKLFLNDGTGIFIAVEDAFTNTADPSLGLAIGDLNGDGILDAVTAQGEGNPQLNLVHLGHNLSGVDVTPPKFRAVEQPTTVEPGEVIVLRMAVVDAHTSETGEHVKSVSVSYQVDGGETKTLPAYFIGGDLFRVDIPAQAGGSVVTVMPSAIDRQDLESEPFSFDITVGPEPEPEPEPDAGSEPEPDAGAEPAPDAGAEPEPDAGSEPEPDAGTEPEPEPDAGMEPGDGDGDGDGDEGGDGDGDAEPAPSKKSNDGCSVSGPSDASSAGFFSLLGLALLGLRARRRMELSRRN